MLSIDREHAATFGRFLWRRFLDDECFQTAGALSYTTIFALVPLTAAVFGVLSAFPVFSVWTQELVNFIFQNFVPAAGETVRDYVLQFAANADKMTGIGLVVLLASALAMMAAIESRLNRIWRVRKSRSSVARFLLYWTALTLVPILLVSGLALSSYLFALPVLRDTALQTSLHEHLLHVLPFLTTLVALLLLYMLVPNRRVLARHALVGALLGACLFELAKWGLGFYVSHVPTYQQLYGALAVVPIFLVWVFLSWVIVLLGASVTASLTSFDYRPVSERLPPGCEFVGLLHVLKHFVRAQHDGAVVHGSDIRRAEPSLSADLLERCLNDLVAASMIRQSEDLGWVLVRNPATIDLLQVYEAGAYRITLDAASLAHWSRGLPAPVRELLAAMAGDAQARLATRLDQLFTGEACQQATDQPTVS